MAFQYPPSPLTRAYSSPFLSPTNSPPPRRYDCPAFPPSDSPRTPTQASLTSPSASKPTYIPRLLLTPPSIGFRTVEHNRGTRSPDMPNLSSQNPAGPASEVQAQVTGWKPTLPSVRPFYDPAATGATSQTSASLAVRRRQSRFDPMGKDDDMEDDGFPYGELGGRHPLRRVAEEETSKEDGSVSLPGIKALFGVAGGSAENQQLPTPSSSVSLFPSPSLPSLTPNSPSSSPSTARTSRYSSLASVKSAGPEPFASGWWAPDFERSSPSSASSPLYPPNHRANSFPTTQAFIDEHADKRRRSDGPFVLRDPEESARLRWQAQSRNASFPAASPGGPSTPGGLRSLLHPPPASSAMSRQSISGSSSLGTPMSPWPDRPGQPGTPDGYFADRRIAPVPSRSGSIVGGQLAQSFADLTASERDRRSPLPPSHAPHPMGPPGMPSSTDRRGSSYYGSRDVSPRPSLPSLHPPRPSSTGPSPSGPSLDALRRQSLTRPPTPEMPNRPTLSPRRSSLTELIMANTGDNVAMASGRFVSPVQSVPLERPSLSEPSGPYKTSPQRQSGPIISGWQPTDRRISTDSAASTPGRQGISLNSDGEGSAQSQRGKKRGVMDHRGMEMNHAPPPGAIDPGMQGMEVLAESASRVQEEMDEGSPPGQVIMSGAGPKYACAFCAKTFSRPSSLRIHTYSHTGERPYVCKEPSCRRRFSVQSNLKRHAKVHQLGAPGMPGHAQAGQARTIERSHRHDVQPHVGPGQGYYHPHQHPHPHPHGPPHPQDGYGQPGPGQASPYGGYPQGYGGYEPGRAHHTGPRGHGPGRDEEDDDEEEEDIDELDDDEAEEGK